MNRKNRLDSSSLLRLAKYCRRYTIPILLCTVLILSVSLISIEAPEGISDITDTLLDGVQNGIDFPVLVRICLRVGIMYAAVAILQYVYTILCDYITHKTAFSLRRDIGKKITRLPLNFFDNIQRGEIISRTTNDVDAVSDALTKNVSGIVSAIVMFVGVIWKMFATNFKLSFVAIGVALVSTSLMYFLAALSQKHYIEAQQNLGALTGYIEEVFNNHELLQIFNTKRMEKKRFRVINNMLYKSNWKASRISVTMTPLVSIIELLGYTLIMIFGCSYLLCDEPTITFGELTAFLIYAEMFSSPLSNIAGYISSVQKTSAAANRVFELLNTKEQTSEIEKPGSFPPVRGDITFSHVWFGYKKGVPVLRDLNLDVKAGEKIAILGPSGVGKTTLVNLMMRFYDIHIGEIRIDGRPINSYKREAVRKLFDMVLQDTWLFNGTIRENLTFSNPLITDDEMNFACREVGIAAYIDALPNGYDTKISNLSGISEGQRQQLAIVRVMLKNAPFLIFDEATSSLDSRTEMLIQNVLSRHMNGKTCFIIAHRMSTVRKADRIIVMQGGTIVECGTHNELIKHSGVYRAMYERNG